jgi:glycosyltransferase involved in cell wall biosynthesis
MSRIVVNCRKVRFESTLGGAHALLRLSEALADEHELIFAVNDVEATDDGPAGPTIRSIATRVTDFETARSDGDLRRSAVELLPVHFQPPLLCDRSVMLCLDLHVFDIPWKYEHVERLQDSFRRNLLAASAVLTMFPRTYYSVERTAGITLRNLFLTESPLLLDGIRPSPEPAQAQVRSDAVPRLLYPAQLQLHKNHEGLVRGVAELRHRGSHVKITCPGSDYDPLLTCQITSLVDVLDVGDSFEFLGRVSDETMMELYRHADAVIVPSLAEGGAYVPLEAIAFGKPVAVNEIDSARMHLDSVNGNVIWFDANDPGWTADAIQRLIDADPVEWLHKNATARERIAAATWESVASKWSAVIGMVEGTRPRPTVRIDRHASEIVYA